MPVKRSTKRDKRYRQLAVAVAGGESRFEAGRRLGLDRATIDAWHACRNWRRLVKVFRGGLTGAAAIKARAELDARRPAVDALFARVRSNKTGHGIAPPSAAPPRDARRNAGDAADPSTDAQSVALCDVRASGRSQSATNRPELGRPQP